MALHHLHIHKAAGTSFARYLMKFFEDEAVCPARFEHQFENAFQPGRHRFVTGHISMATVARAAPAYELVTILRDPRERLISAFNHWKRHALDKRDQITPGTGFLGRFVDLSIEAFLSSEDPATKKVTDNVVARLLAGGSFGLTPATRAQVSGPEADTDSILAAASGTLRSARFFGFADRLHEAQHIWSRLHDLPFQPAIHLNAAPEPTVITQELGVLLNARTELDRRVHEEALALYEDRFGALAADFRQGERRGFS